MNSIDPNEKRKALAERFFRGVYGGNPSVVDELAGDAIVASYPIFQTIFGAPVIRGIKAYRDHAANFNRNWTDAEVTIHSVVAENHFVVLMWDFQATRTGAEVSEGSTAAEKTRWGGITLFEFDGNGKIVGEIGEESQPGPIGRMASAGS